MHARDTQPYLQLFTNELKQISHFHQNDELLTQVQDQCRRAVTRTIGGHDKILTRFATDCFDIFGLNEKTIKADQITALKKNELHFTPIPISADMSPTLPDFPTWNRTSLFFWNKKEDADIVLLKKKSLYITAVTVFLETYTDFVDVRAWNSAEVDKWRDASVKVLNPSFLKIVR